MIPGFCCRDTERCGQMSFTNSGSAEKYNVDLHVDEYSSEKATEKSVGEALASVIAWAHENGIDPENGIIDAPVKSC